MGVLAGKEFGVSGEIARQNINLGAMTVICRYKTVRANYLHAEQRKTEEKKTGIDSPKMVIQ